MLTSLLERQTLTYIIKVSLRRAPMTWLNFSYGREWLKGPSPLFSTPSQRTCELFLEDYSATIKADLT
jgi:hypothetical protein